MAELAGHAVAVTRNMPAQHPNPAPSDENAMDALRASLKRCPEATCEAAMEYRRTRSPTSLGPIALGILTHYTEPDLRNRLATFDPALRLVEDLGLDSLAKLQAVMLLEEVLQVSFNERELSDMRTLGDVVRVTGAAAANGANA
jgi:acyl carrier protein